MLSRITQKLICGALTSCAVWGWKAQPASRGCIQPFSWKHDCWYKLTKGIIIHTSCEKYTKKCDFVWSSLWSKGLTQTQPPNYVHKKNNSALYQSTIYQKVHMYILEVELNVDSKIASKISHSRTFEEMAVTVWYSTHSSLRMKV